VSEVRNYEDVTPYTLDDDSERELLEAQNECTFMWANRGGWPVGVIMSYVWRNGRFWLTASRQRARITALRRDNRASICITSKGTALGANQTATYKGRVTIHDDEPTKTWFYPALAQALHPTDEEWQAHFVAFLDSPRRVVLELTPVQRIAFDGRKMGRATAEWVAQGRSSS
jgi:hypothetical protein